MKLHETECTQCLGKYNFTCQKQKVGLHPFHRHKINSARAAQQLKPEKILAKLSRIVPKSELLFFFFSKESFATFKNKAGTILCESIICVVKVTKDAYTVIITVCSSLKCLAWTAHKENMTRHYE